MEISKLVTPPPFLQPNWRPKTSDFTLLDRQCAVKADCIIEPLSQSSEEYKYHPLDTEKQQIRLVKLQPPPPAAEKSKSANTLQCELETFDVDTSPCYISLSYMWGAPQPRRTIYVNGKPFQVRSNLYDFLETFVGDQASNHYIWIDQMCIDQNSIDERNHQVRLMSQIYRNCLFVISWLGSSSEPAARRFLIAPNTTNGKTLLENRYFTRVWIVQEILLAPEVYFLCGKVWIAFEALVTVVKDPGYHQNDRLSPSDWIFTQKTNNHMLLPLNLTLGRFACMDSHDPHDKIYGLLGLVAENERPEVDYNKSLHETFLDTIKISFDLSWKLEMVIQNGNIQLEQAFQRKMLVHDLAGDLGLIKGHSFEFLKFLSQLDTMAVLRAGRQESCLMPKIGFDEPYWWCEDKSKRCIFSCPVYEN